MDEDRIHSLDEILSNERIRNRVIYAPPRNNPLTVNFDPEQRGAFHKVFFHGTDADREEYIGEGLPKIRDWLARILKEQGIDPYTVNLVSIAEFLVRTNRFYDNHCSRLDSDQRTRRFFTQRGLLFYGPCGTGKTLIAERVAQMWDFWFLPVVRAERVFLDPNGGPDEYRYLWGQHVENPSRVVVVDDLGRETGDKCWGSSFPIADLIETRFQFWQHKECRTPTIFTTNLPDMTAVEQRYGAPLKRRLLEMCEPVLFEGNAGEGTIRAAGANGDTSWLDRHRVP